MELTCPFWNCHVLEKNGYLKVEFVLLVLLNGAVIIEDSDGWVDLSPGKEPELETILLSLIRPDRA